MEDTLGDFRRYNYEYQRSCLNPCSNGRYSRRVPKVKLKGVACVLILVLMEDTLGEQDLRILYFRGFDNNKTY